MREQHFTFPSWNGSNEIHAVHWIPDGEIRMVVQISHGMSEHIRRYRAFAEHLSHTGFLCAGMTTWGMGILWRTQTAMDFFQKKTEIGRWFMITQSDRADKKKISGCSLRSDGAQHGLVSGTSVCVLLWIGAGWCDYLRDRLSFGRRASFLRLHFCRGLAAVKGWKYHSRFLDWMLSGS